MKTSLFSSLTVFMALCLSTSFAPAAVICGETIDSSKIDVRDNYLSGEEFSDKAFMDATIFEGPQFRTTICDKGSNRYLIVKKTDQAATDPSGATVFTYPVQIFELANIRDLNWYRLQKKDI